MSLPFCDQTKQQTLQSIIFSVNNRVGVLQDCLNIFSKLKIDLQRIESRPAPKSRGTECYDFYVEFSLPEEKVLTEVVTQLKKECEHVAVQGDTAKVTEAETMWFPRRITDLDKFVHRVMAYGKELDADHPGFKDEAYRARRREITSIASNYKHGREIPRVEYTEEEINTWRQVYTKLTALYKTNACSQHNYVLPLLEQNCGYGPDNIPQLQDISTYLKQCTGWSLRPVAGLLSSRDFLNGLAFRVFHSTQYIRHSSAPFYTPEPDVCHELLGHVPLFCDPAFAEFSQEIGLASLGASEEDITKLATCYWFTIEFGLCKEKKGDGSTSIKAFGAGLLSSAGELEYCLSDKPEKRPFNPEITAQQEYPITKYQPVYFVADSFEDAKKKLREYAATLDRPFDVYYNPYTQCIEVLDNRDKIVQVLRNCQQQVAAVTSALQRINF